VTDDDDYPVLDSVAAGEAPRNVDPDWSEDFAGQGLDLAGNPTLACGCAPSMNLRCPQHQQVTPRRRY